MRLALLALLAGCTEFEDPTIVLDLRVLGMQATPPEIILDIDPEHPPTLDELTDQLSQIPITVRALVAEPNRPADLTWTMTACVLDRGGRCDGDELQIPFASGVLHDPEQTGNDGTPCPGGFFEPPGVLCGRLVPDNVLVQLLAKQLMDDPAHGLGGIDIGISLEIVGSTAVFAAKHVLVAPRVPAERAANNNPHIDQLLLGQEGVGLDVFKAHCADIDAPTNPINRVKQGDIVTIFPVSRDGDKEEFVLPTLDGGTEHFTEFLSYQWIATAGSFTDDVTGGPPDAFGNVKLDGTQWKAPKVDARSRVTVWVIQRDARYGENWREACIQVEPQ